MKGTQSDSELSYQLILSKIVSHEYAPGKHLNQLALSEELSVSRTPINAALHMLVADGFVDKIKNRGFFVHKWSLREVVDLFVIREAFERIAAYDTAMNATDAQIDEMIALFDPVKPYAEKGTDFPDKAAYFNIDRDFHRLLFAFNTNKLLKRMSGTLQVMESSFVIGNLRDPLETYREHRQIFEAIKIRDANAAALAAEIHIHNTRIALQSASDKMTKLKIFTD